MRANVAGNSAHYSQWSRGVYSCVSYGLYFLISGCLSISICKTGYLSTYLDIKSSRIDSTSVSKGYIFFSIFSNAIQCWYFVLFSGTKPENLILKNKTKTLLLYSFFFLAFYFRKWEMCSMALGFSLTGVTKWSTCFQSARHDLLFKELADK